MTADEWAAMYKRLDNGENMAEVARQTNVDYHTLQRRYNKRAEGVSRRGPPPKLGRRGEAALVAWLQECERIGMCVSLKQLAEVAKRIAADLDLLDTFKGGRAWFDAFMKRHPELSVRKSEKTEHARLYALAPWKLNEYFLRLKPLIINREAGKIWNLDEIGWDLMNINSSNVRTQVNGRQVGQTPVVHSTTVPFIILCACRLSRQRARSMSSRRTTATAITLHSSQLSTPPVVSWDLL